MSKPKRVCMVCKKPSLMPVCGKCIKLALRQIVAEKAGKKNGQPPK